MFCPACGEKIPDNVTFCPKCGANVKEYMSGNVPAKPKKKVKPAEKDAEIMERKAQIRPGGTLRRIIAYIIDAILLGIIIFFVKRAIPFFDPLQMPDLSGTPQQDWMQAFNQWRQSIPWYVTTLSNVFDFLVNWVYFAGLEVAASGQTLGKMILGIQSKRYSAKKGKTKDLEPKAAVANGFMKANILLLLLDIIIGLLTKKGDYDRLNQFRVVPQKTKTIVVQK